MKAKQDTTSGNITTVTVHVPVEYYAMAEKQAAMEGLSIREWAIRGALKAAREARQGVERPA